MAVIKNLVIKEGTTTTDAGVFYETDVVTPLETRMTAAESDIDALQSSVGSLNLNNEQIGLFINEVDILVKATGSAWTDVTTSFIESQDGNGCNIYTGPAISSQNSYYIETSIPTRSGWEIYGESFVVTISPDDSSVIVVGVDSTAPMFLMIEVDANSSSTVFSFNFDSGEINKITSLN